VNRQLQPSNQKIFKKKKKEEPRKYQTEKGSCWAGSSSPVMAVDMGGTLQPTIA
jgi:hypothetical protein